MKLNTELYDGCETFEITLNANVLRYNFPDIVELRGKIIRRINFFDFTIIPNSPQGTGLLSLLTDGFLTLAYGNIEMVKNYPIANLRHTDNRTELFNHKFDIKNSYVEFARNNGFTTGQVLLVTVFYQNPKTKRYSYTLDKHKIDYCESLITDITEDLLPITNFRNLLKKKIYWLTVFNQIITGFLSPDGRTLANTNAVKESFLNLSNGERNIVNNLPLITMVNDENTVSQIFFNGLIVDWDKSYIQIADTGVLNLGEVFYFNVMYKD